MSFFIVRFRRIFHFFTIFSIATFITYEAAIEAEEISEGFSTLSAFRENAVAKRKRNDSKSDNDSNGGSPKK